MLKDDAIDESVVNGLEKSKERIKCVCIILILIYCMYGTILIPEEIRRQLIEALFVAVAACPSSAVLLAARSHLADHSVVFRPSSPKHLQPWSNSISDDLSEPRRKSLEISVGMGGGGEKKKQKHPEIFFG